MGGQNHHMCTGCIRHTTLLSKTFSLAQAEMLLGNAVLEDTMVAELYESMDHAKHFARQIKRHLLQSITYLNETIEMAEEILRIEEMNPYQNGPALSALDFNSFRKALERKGIDVDHDKAWEEMAAVFRNEGIRGSFNMFIRHLGNLKDLVEVVLQSIEEASQLSATGRKMVDTFEENHADFKGRFARLMTGFSTTSLTFSYAALVTTEAHLLTNNFRSLQSAA